MGPCTYRDKRKLSIFVLRFRAASTIKALVKLIQSKKVNVQDILPSDKITELSEAFKHYKEESLNAMKRAVW
jgi:threonine dehydrogenase-like Zn-dependent dehydrogenase